MLTPSDDLPVHQLPTTLDHVGSSDPRWFDRYWFVVYEPHGRVAVATGLGVYRNMNVVDGFGCAVVGATQHNARFSRALRPDFAIGVGPLRYEVLEGLRRFRLVLEPGSRDVSFDLEFEAEFDAFEEDHHFARVGGVVSEDYVRFYQHGRARGSVTVAGETFRSDDFWSFRDRSFGVRPGIAGALPTPAPDASAQGGVPGLGIAGRAGLFFGCAFGTDELAGCCTFGETADGSILKIDGRYVRTGETAPRVFRNVEHDLEFFDSGAVRGGSVSFEAGAGDVLEIRFEELTAPFAYPGFGYGDGYFDQQGLGVYRGESVAEADRYSVSADRVVDETGRRQFPGRVMLDQPMRIRANQRDGFMEVVAGLLPGHRRYPPGGSR